MPSVKFKSCGAPFWCEYKAHDYDDIELLAITAEDSEINLLDLLVDSVELMAIEAAMQDYAELHQYKMDKLRKEWQNPA